MVGYNLNDYLSEFSVTNLEFGIITNMHTQNLIENPFIPYSFNGMEKDDEVKGEGNSYNFGARMLDPRVGRWLSIDACFKSYSSVSPYCYAANSPLLFMDPNGKWIVKVTGDKISGFTLVFVAQENDNIETLSLQMGIPIEKLKPHMETTSITKDTELKLSTLQIVSDINNSINESVINDATNNCASFAAFANGLKIDFYNSPKGPNLDEMDKLLSEKFSSELIQNASIGSIVRYNLNGNLSEFSVSNLGFDIFTATDEMKIEWYAKAQYGAGPEDLKTLLDPSNKESADYILGEMKVIAENLKNTFENERHYAVILLKTSDGQGIQNLIQKHGGESLNTEDLSPSPDLMPIDYTEKPLNNDNSAVYEKKGN